MPKEITKNGLKLENEVILRATPDRIIVDEVRVGPTDAEVGAVKVEGFKIQYKREGDEWLGAGEGDRSPTRASVPGSSSRVGA